jgi:hypothetical protein
VLSINCERTACFPDKPTGSIRLRTLYTARQPCREGVTGSLCLGGKKPLVNMDTLQLHRLLARVRSKVAMLLHSDVRNHYPMRTTYKLTTRQPKSIGDASSPCGQNHHLIRPPHNLYLTTVGARIMFLHPDAKIHRSQNTSQLHHQTGIEALPILFIDKSNRI